MFKRIKVHIQYPWKVSDSQYYKSLIENPPKGIDYFSSKEKAGMIVSKKKLFLSNLAKHLIREFNEKLKLVIPNVHTTKTKQKYDLIHCAHCLSKNNSPWVADFENWWQMWISGRDTKKGHEKVLKILKNKNCKKIMVWTEAGKKEILRRFPEIRDKVEVVSYAIPLPKIKKSKKNKITLLFLGRYFYEKGGLDALKSIDILTKKYNHVEGIFISQTPKEILKKYSKNKNIKFYGLIHHEKLKKEILPKADIFIYPGYSDTFGFAFVEALAYGIPIITIEGFAREELVITGETGFIIKRRKNSKWYPPKEEGEKIVSELVKKTSKLIEDKKLRKNMSKKGRKIIKEGKFSIDYRNKKLKRIYEEAISKTL